MEFFLFENLKHIVTRICSIFKLTVSEASVSGRPKKIPDAEALTFDRDIFRRINADVYGVIVADAGYVSGQLERDMNIENRRWLLIRPYRTMKKLAAIWQLMLYAGRFRIEFDFRDLKMFHGLVTSLPRSVSGYLANCLHALVSFVLA